MTVARQVVAGQVHQHHVFCILLGVIAQIFGSLTVGLCVARALGRACYRVDVSLVALDAAVGLRT